MGMVTSSGFANQVITLRKKTTTIGSHKEIVSSWTDGTSYKACVYSKAIGMSYIDAGLWKEDVEYVAMIDYTTDVISTSDRFKFNGVDYAIDYVDDVAFQHEAMFIGLKAAK